ncbi:Oidioi.mRNA.OKI2018_I69.chr2.g7996.t1.cds [Oikopleura dioica]|uniref:Leucine-rich repeat-containing protein 51 n=1 Tax=Oikopleura dioica TaxID=34765 RepID=A0ABN7TG83_OIKDI|nr:Oidioi.mRNA.OKI2018_I69.chr2.g7996.t1.cds [Oikopleura dioica]
MTQEVLDFGFRDLETLEDFSLETKGIYDDSEYAKNDEGLYTANKSLRLRNNQLASIDGLSEKLSTMIVDHTALQWLDLSFNQIAKIGNSFNDLVSLKVLYLHGNSIRPGYSLVNR